MHNSASINTRPLIKLVLPLKLALYGRLFEVSLIAFGWLVVEAVVRGVLVYGIRKSFLLKGARHGASYEHYMGLHDSEGAHAKMQEALDLIQDETES